MINLNSQYPTKTNVPDANYTYGSARNITTPGDGTGTPWEQALVNDIIGFQQALLAASSIVPSGSPETILACDQLDALFAILQSVRNPFINFAHFRDEKTTGTDGGTFTAGSLQTRDINTTLVNNITGASLAANQITLPTGSYQIQACASVNRVAAHQLVLYNITDAAAEVVGENAYAATDDVNGSTALMSGPFAIASAKVLELQHECAGTRATTGFGVANSFGRSEIYSDIKIWKLD